MMVIALKTLKSHYDQQKGKDAITNIESSTLLHPNFYGQVELPWPNHSTKVLVLSLHGFLGPAPLLKFTSPVGSWGLYGSLGRPKGDRSGKNVKSAFPISNRAHSCVAYSMGLDKCTVCPPFQ